MRVKDTIRLFIPPIYYRFKSLFIRDEFKANTIHKLENHFSSYLNEMNKNADCNFSNLNLLSRSFTLEDIMSISNNQFESFLYGHFLTLQRYADMPIFNVPPVSFSIQHGVMHELKTSQLTCSIENLFVWSEYIKSLYLTNTKVKNCIAIGAPFFYSVSLLSEDEIQKEKKRLGKNLLAIPMHSTAFVNNVYDSNNFIKILNVQKKNFDTVRVCLYWKDIQRGEAKKYLEAGFECVCCGHNYDQLFLRRQRSLFEIADATISNGFGSHIGYSIYLNKPHWLIPEDFELRDDGGQEAFIENKFLKESNTIKEIIKLFEDNKNFNITQGQINVADKYWGISSIKTKEEIKEIIKNLNYSEYVYAG